MTDFDEDMQKRVWKELVLKPRIIIGILILLIILLIVYILAGPKDLFMLHSV